MSSPSFPGDITGLGHDGRGICHDAEGKVVFVTNALPGEKVQYKITKKHKKRVEAIATEIESPAPTRVQPRCEVYMHCGGCRLQHLAHEEQLRLKQNILLEQLAHFGKVHPENILPPIQADPWHYRHKARFSVHFNTKRDEVLVGFRERNGRFTTNMTTCEILAGPGHTLISPLRELLQTISIKHKIPQIEVAMDDASCALIFRHLQPFTENDLTQLSDFAKTYNCHLYLQSGGPKTIRLHYPEGGNEYLQYSHPEFNCHFQFHPAHFTQVNPEINRLMVLAACKWLDPRDATVLDLFCGLGNFSLPLATLAKHVTGIEAVAEMIEQAEHNAKLGQLTNTEFFTCDLFKPPFNAPWAKRQYDKILIDPPRSGALEVIQMIDQFQANTIVYVSCNPATLARDSEILVHHHRYQLTHAGIIDMFPHTHHIEAMAVFTK